MKKIINRKRYDTTTATHAVHVENDCGNFGGHGQEDLYLTPKGAWFRVINGTKQYFYFTLSTWNPRLEANGKLLVPMTPAQTEDWLELNDCTEALEKFFGDEIEDAQAIQVHLQRDP